MIWRALFVAALLAIAAVVWIGSGMVGETKAVPEATKPPAELERVERIQAVRTKMFTLSEFNETVTLAATTAADKRTVISAEVSGRLETVNISKGDRVEVGDIIASVETDTRQASLNQAQAAYEQALTDHNATTQLAERGFVSKNRVRQTEAALSAAKANLEVAEQSLENLAIVSTVAGLVENVTVEAGALAAQGAPIATIISVDLLLIVAEASEQEIDNIKIGDRAVAVTATGMEMEGEISFIAAVANSATRTFRIEISAPNPTGDVLEGMSAEVTLTRPVRSAHLIPSSLMSLGPDGQIGMKYVGPDNVVQFTPADLVNATPDGVWLEGLSREVQVITVGQEFVKVGETVKVVDEADLDAELTQSGTETEGN